jgi:glycosyltransferase involved in cell wall biosynthesis
MKIGIDLSITTRNQAGTAVYARNLINALKQLSTGDEYVEFQLASQREMGTPKNLKSRIGTLYHDILWIQLFLPIHSRLAKLDILHMPANVIPFYSPCPTVVSILDTTIFHFPKNFPAWQRLSSQFFIPLSAKRANRIITISEQSKKDICLKFNVPNEKVTVTYLAASSQFRVQAAKEVSKVKAKYDLQNFILTVGTLEPRKNIKRLIQAFAKVHPLFPSLNLVHAGPLGWMYENILLEVDKCGISNCVMFLGRVPIDDLVALYNAAEVFVYPSLYEGFGLPVLEAMSCGCPVVTSKTSSLPEIVGDAAILIDPINVDELAEAIQTILEDHELHRSLGSKGLERAKKFSWEKCAQETIYVYNQAVNT